MFEKYLEYLRGKLDKQRFDHSIAVAEKCEYLAKKYGYNPEKAYIAGLLHDVTKQETEQKQLQIAKEFGIMFDELQLTTPKLMHAVTGAAVAQHILGVDDREITEAIKYHTTARANMSLLEKLLYVADFISDDRDFPGVEFLRKLAEDDFETAIFECLEFTVNELEKAGMSVHKDTLEAYEERKF